MTKRKQAETVLKTAHGELEQTVSAHTQDLADTVRRLQKEIRDLKRVEEGLSASKEALRLVVEGTSSAIGKDFFRSLVQHLAAALQVRIAFLSEYLGPKVRIVAMWGGDNFAEPIEYNLKGTPCEQVFAHNIAYFPADVQKLFPESQWLRERGVQSYLAIPFFDASANPIGHMGVMDDKPMTKTLERESTLRIFAVPAGAELERQRAEKALQEREEEFRLLFDNASDAIFWIDPVTDTIINCNKAAEILLERKREDIIGQGQSILRSPSESGASSGIFERNFEQDRQRSTEEDVEIVTSSLESKFVHITTSETKIRGRTVIQALLRDLTERRRLEKEVLRISAEEQQRIWLDLHDSVGQELTGVSLLTKSLAKRLSALGSPEEATARKVEEGIGQAIDAFHRAVRGIAPLKKDPAGLVAALQLLATSTAENTGIDCRFKCHGSVVNVYDYDTATHLYHIAQEAVTNAVRHAQARHIIVTLASAQGTINLAIRDDGKGITPDRMKGKGKGMGLRIIGYRASTIGATCRFQPAEGGGVLVNCSLRQT